MRVVAAVLAALLVVSVGGFSWYRWLAGDDALDIQGTWYIAGTDTLIVITEEQIVLNEEVSYGYVLDESAKTIDFTFSYLEGAGHYRFSLDRQMLAIMDGKFGWWDTLGDDLAWLPGALVDALGGATASPAGSGGVTLLSRDPPSAQTPDAPASPSGEIADAATADPNAADAEGHPTHPRAPAPPTLRRPGSPCRPASPRLRREAGALRFRPDASSHATSSAPNAGTCRLRPSRSSASRWGTGE